ncbi:hypothetical protein B484DRAFT_460102 [Ochromonadaceae sp. CCMP2298]|nr:hypothetical protein B484DRAFT_460102 [Ochromonadaceae sp. CCMP2298]
MPVVSLRRSRRDKPSSQPTTQPTGHPSGQPTTQPSGEPTSKPTMQPSGQPTSLPTSQPTDQRSEPTSQAHPGRGGRGRVARLENYKQAQGDPKGEALHECLAQSHHPRAARTSEDHYRYF